MASGSQTPLIKPPPKAQAELVDSVRNWVHFDNLAESLNKQVNNVRTMRSSYEEKILTMLETQNMRNAVLQITGASLQRQTRIKPTDLSWGFLEDQLHEYYKTRGKPDETAQLLDYIQKNRGSKSMDYLKKTATPL
jgi:hypothetical protein